MTTRPRTALTPQPCPTQATIYRRPHLGAIFADALPLSGANWYPGELMAIGGALGREALRVELIGMLPMLRMALDRIRHHRHMRPGRDGVAVDLVGLDGHAGDP